MNVKTPNTFYDHNTCQLFYQFICGQKRPFFSTYFLFHEIVSTDSISYEKESVYFLEHLRTSYLIVFSMETRGELASTCHHSIGEVNNQQACGSQIIPSYLICL